MSVKLFNATADQIAKAAKKAAKNSPDFFQQMAEMGAVKQNGNLSAKRIKASLLQEAGDYFTKSGKLNDKARIEFMQDGLTKKTKLKDFVKSKCANSHTKAAEKSEIIITIIESAKKWAKKP